MLSFDKNNLQKIIQNVSREAKQVLLNYTQISDKLEGELTQNVYTTYYVSGILEQTQSLKEFGLVMKILPNKVSQITFVFSWKKLISINIQEDKIIVCNQNQQLCELENKYKEIILVLTTDSKHWFGYINDNMIIQYKYKYSLQSIVFDNILLKNFNIYDSYIPYACLYYFIDNKVEFPIYDSGITNLMLKRKKINGFLLPNYKLKQSKGYIQIDTFLGETLETLQLILPDVNKFSYQYQLDILTYAQIRPLLNQKIIHMNNFYAARYLNSINVYNWFDNNQFFQQDKKCKIVKNINYQNIKQEKYNKKFDLNLYCQEIENMKTEQYQLRSSSSYINYLQQQKQLNYDQIGIFCCTSAYLFSPSQFYTQLTLRVIQNDQIPQFINSLYIQLCQRINDVKYQKYEYNLNSQRKQIYRNVIQNKSIKVAQTVINYVLTYDNLFKTCQLDTWLQFLEDIDKIEYCKFMTSQQISDYYLQYLQYRVQIDQNNIPQDAISRYYILVLLLQNRLQPQQYLQYYIEIIESIKILWISIQQHDKDYLQYKEDNKYLQCIFNQQQVYLQNLYILSMLEQNDQENILQYLIRSLYSDLDNLTMSICNLQNTNLTNIYNQIINQLGQSCKISQNKIYLDQLIKLTMSNPKLFENNQQSLVELSSISTIDQIAKCFLIYVIYAKEQNIFKEDVIIQFYEQFKTIIPNNFTLYELMQKNKNQLINQSYSIAVYSLLLSHYYQYANFTLIMIDLIPTQFVNLKNQMSEIYVQEELQKQLFELIKDKNIKHIDNIINCIVQFLPKYSQQFQKLTKFQQTEDLQIFESYQVKQKQNDKIESMFNYSIPQIHIQDYFQNQIIKERLSNRFYGKYQLQLFYNQIILNKQIEQTILSNKIYLSQIINLQNMLIAVQCLYTIKSEISQEQVIFILMQDQIVIMENFQFEQLNNFSIQDCIIYSNKHSNILQLNKKDILYINTRFVKHRQTGIDIYTKLGYVFSFEIGDIYTLQQVKTSFNAEIIRGVVSKLLLYYWQLNDNCKYQFEKDILNKNIDLNFYSINKFTLQSPDTFNDEQIKQELKKKLNENMINYIKSQQQKILEYLNNYEENKNQNQFLFVNNQNSLLYQVLLLSGFKEMENQNQLKGKQGIFDFLIALQNSGILDNLQVIYLINLLSSRSQDDIQQDIIYPITTNRTMYLPVQAQYQERFDQINERYQQLLKLDQQNQNDQITAQQALQCNSFQNGSFCSCGSNSIYYAIRIQPFTSAHIDLQGGHFDNPNRLFYNIEQLSVKQFENGFKELTPICLLSQNYMNLYNQQMGITDDKLQVNNLYYNHNQEQIDSIRTNIQFKKKQTSFFQQQDKNQNQEQQEQNNQIIQESDINNPLGLSFYLIQQINQININDLIQWLNLFYGHKRQDTSICNQYMQQCYYAIIQDLTQIRSLIDQNSYFGVMPEQVFKQCNTKLLKYQSLVNMVDQQIELENSDYLIKSNDSNYKAYKGLFRFELKEIINNCLMLSPHLNLIKKYDKVKLSFKQRQNLDLFNLYVKIINNKHINILNSNQQQLISLSFNNRIRNAHLLRTHLILQFQHQIIIYKIKHYLNNQQLYLEIQQQITKEIFDNQTIFIHSTSISSESSVLCAIIQTSTSQILFYYDIFNDIILKKEETNHNYCQFISNDFLVLKQSQDKLIEIKNSEGITFCQYRYDQYQDFNPKISSTNSLYDDQYKIILYDKNRLQFYKFSDQLFKNTIQVNVNNLYTQQVQQFDEYQPYYAQLDVLNQQPLQVNNYGVQVNNIPVCDLQLQNEIIFNENIQDLGVNIKDIINIQLEKHIITLMN